MKFLINASKQQVVGHHVRPLRNRRFRNEELLLPLVEEPEEEQVGAGGARRG